MVKINLRNAITDFMWVVKVLNSSKDGNHLVSSLKCFYLWESKYKRFSPTKSQTDTLDKLKSHFWIQYHNKSNELSFH
jgi:hypothetical protein